MKQITLPHIDWMRIFPYIVIAILCFILFNKCNNDNSKLANDLLKQKEKISNINIKKYTDKINSLNDSLSILNNKKKKQSIKIVTIIKEVEAKSKEVENLTTNQISKFYQNRYNDKVVITQYGVALKDTIAKQNIVELIQKDGLRQELSLTKNILLIEEKKGIVKDSIIIHKDSIISEKSNIIVDYKQIEKNLNSSIKSQKTKTNFWKVASGVVLGVFLVNQVK
jgi:hypothetical protein